MASRDFIADNGEHNATMSAEVDSSAISRFDPEAPTNVSLNEISREDIGELK